MQQLEAGKRTVLQSRTYHRNIRSRFLQFLQRVQRITCQCKCFKIAVGSFQRSYYQLAVHPRCIYDRYTNSVDTHLRVRNHTLS